MLIPNVVILDPKPTSATAGYVLAVEIEVAVMGKLFWDKIHMADHIIPGRELATKSPTT